MTEELFDPYEALGIPQDASQELVEIAYDLIQKRFKATEKGKRGVISPNQLRDAKRAYELLTSPNLALSAMKETRLNENRQTFNMRVSLSRTQLPVINEDQIVYARVDLIAGNLGVTTSERGQSSLNLTLVIDRSNSMHGTRLDRVKAAAFQVIDAMTPDDVLSVVVFSDRAQILIPATKVKDKPALKAHVTMMAAFGGTEIYHGLNEGIRQNREFLDAKYVNHVLLLTDGNTYGDEDQCVQLASTASVEGIGISAMGIGTDWNDEFLDKLASITGGSSQYIRTVNEVSHFINNHIRHLSSSYAERMRLIFDLAEGVTLDQAFKISPLPQPVEMTDELKVGSLEAHRPTTLLLQFRLIPGLNEGILKIARIIATGDILANEQPAHHVIHDILTEVTSLQFDEEINTHILDALSRLALYRMQEQANESIKRGEFEEATRRLERLATRLLAMGQQELATHVLHEAREVKTTHMLSADGKKTIKYSTRLLVNTQQINPDQS